MINYCPPQGQRHYYNKYRYPHQPWTLNNLYNKFYTKYMNQTINELEINGSVYVLKGSNQNAKSESLDGMHGSGYGSCYGKG